MNMDYLYLSPKHLIGFRSYKYSSLDTSPLSVYIMHPFWNKVVLLCPRWVAPNLLTFVGFLFTAGACLLLSYYDYYFYASSSDHPEYPPIPRWVFLVTSVSIFIAYTLDGIDGKHARRTQTSGPLGELFDHGLDSWMVVLILTSLYSVFERTDFSVPPICYFVCCLDGIDGKQARRTRTSGPLGELFDHGLDSWMPVLIPTSLYSVFGRTNFSVPPICYYFVCCLDGIDGKQARRTRTSGPLGELFDHGLDSWTAVLIPTCLYSVFGRTDFSVPPIRYYFVCWNVFLTFYSSHWEKYNTGVLFLPWGYDFSMIASTLVFLVTYLLGHEWWKFTVYGNIATGHILEILFYLSSFAANLPVVLWNIYKSYRDRTGKMRSFWEANRPLIPVIKCLSVCAIWAYHSPSDIISRDPRAYFLMSGTIFSNICCRLIVAQMSNNRCEIYNWLLGPAFLCTGVAILLPSYGLELCLLYGLWAVSTAAHIHYGTCVVRQICSYYTISCFQIKPPRHSE